MLNGVWPDFIAPPKYENPCDGWEDPALPDFREIWRAAREHGYAVGLHGSMKRDCDLIAAPWTEDASSPDDLIAALCGALNARQVGDIEQKPAGRLAVTIQVDGWVKHIDLSIMPKGGYTMLTNLRAAATLLNPSAWIAIAGTAALLAGGGYIKGQMDGRAIATSKHQRATLAAWEKSAEEDRASLGALGTSLAGELRAERQAREEDAAAAAARLAALETSLNALTGDLANAVQCTPDGHAVVDPDFARMWNDAVARANAGAGNP